MSKLKIVVPVYNCEKWIQKTINSIKLQNYLNFECLLIDDLSTDNTYEVIKNSIKDDNRFFCYRNQEKNFALKNFVEGFKKISSSQEDILITIDGDDWLYHDNVFNLVVEKYKSTGCLLTYGNFIEYPSGIVHPHYSKPYSIDVIKNNLFRNVGWNASHLKTFKNKLWNLIDQEDLIDEETGKFYETTSDLAFMFPMLEMASERIEHFVEPLYVYNKQNPLSDMYIKEQMQLKKAEIIRSKKKYERINL